MDFLLAAFESLRCVHWQQDIVLTGKNSIALKTDRKNERWGFRG